MCKLLYSCRGQADDSPKNDVAASLESQHDNRFNRSTVLVVFIVYTVSTAVLSECDALCGYSCMNQ